MIHLMDGLIQSKANSPVRQKLLIGLKEVRIILRGTDAGRCPGAVKIISQIVLFGQQWVGPVLLQNSARLHACGSNPSPFSAVISWSAASVISCRSSCLSFASMVLLTPACWRHQRSGGGEARWPLFGNRDWSKSFDYQWLKSPGANSAYSNPHVVRDAQVLVLQLSAC